MAAAALREAAKRLVGRALQGRSATSLERRRLVHTRAYERTDGTMDPIERIQNMKEELYTKILECGRDVAGRENLQLAAFLSRQIKPRPDDPHRLAFKIGNNVVDYYRYAGSFCFGHTTAQAFLYLVGEADPKEKGNGLEGNEQEQ